MFTGIIEEVGRVLAVHPQAEGARIEVGASRVVEDLAPGGSIAVDGACLTAVAIRPGAFAADLSPETVARTTLGRRRPGDPVNLERPLRPTDRLGGHFVTGHVDGLGRILERRQTGESWLFAFGAPPSVQALLVPKGSVAVDGISLTVVDLLAEGFTVAIIPHTLRATTLGAKAVGDPVNLEGDLLGKYVQRLLGAPGAPREGRPAGLDLPFLRAHGFA